MNRKYESILMRKALIASGIALVFGSTGAYAIGVNDLFGDISFTTTDANFTMLSASGATVGGTNDVAMTWDGDAFTASSDYTGLGSYSNFTIASTTAFLGHNWTAHDIQAFVVGTYSFDTALGGGNPEAGTLTATVGPGQIGLHILFDWNGYSNIDIFEEVNFSSLFGAGVVRSSNITGCDQTPSAVPVKNCLWDGSTIVAGHTPIANQVWVMASSDSNGDGVMGIPMVADGPFGGFNANFNVADVVTIADISDISNVPIPAAAWLFGSGLLGLIGVVRRKAL